jgi:acyl dehydratase
MSETRTSTPRELDEATIDEVRKRIGVPVRYSPRHHNEVSSTDSFRHFARAYGDDNPLYCERAYAEASSWGGSIAPPLYPFAAGIERKVELSEAERALLKGDPLRGIGQYMCGERWVFPRPIRAGDTLFLSRTLHSAELRPSTFGGGTGALLSHLVSWDDEGGSPYAVRYLDFWHADREKSKAAGTNTGLEKATYDDEQVAELEALYEAEERRGATPRTIDDVEVGDELGTMAKGPLGTTDIVNWHVGVGWGMFGGGTSSLAHKNRKRVPGFYVKNEIGAWDSAQRCHWDDGWAQQMGHPSAYDYGAMRTAWMIHLVTNWMGDDAWLWTISARVRKFNYHGDATYVSGVVREVDREAGSATIDLTGVNQRGVTTCDARMVVLLPRAGGGPARIPDYEPGQVPAAEAP